MKHEVTILTEKHYAWGNPDNPRVPTRRRGIPAVDGKQYSPTLCNEDGDKCCLGFVGEQMFGLREDQLDTVEPQGCLAWKLAELQLPSDAHIFLSDTSTILPKKKGLVYVCPLHDLAVDINDALDEYESRPYWNRMQELIQKFAEKDIAIRFERPDGSIVDAGNVGELVESVINQEGN